jgi:ABC-type polysaccharide/polyol phosphate transport system ATPase subunit
MVTIFQLENVSVYFEKHSIHQRSLKHSLYAFLKRAPREKVHALENVSLTSRAEINAGMDDIIRFSELGEFIDEPVNNYSSGMYARLAFAIATDVRPEVLLVDEVFGVGDEFFMRKCMVRMQRLMQSGSTTIFVSHNLDFLVTQCSRLIWLDKGKIVLDGLPGDVAPAYRLAEGTGLSKAV